MSKYIVIEKKITTLFICFFLCVSVSYGYESEEKNKFEIPYELLTDYRRDETREIIAVHTIQRVFKDIEFKVDESLLVFMMDHPVFLSVALKAMKIGDYVIKHDKDKMYFFDDRKGIIGKFEVIYSGSGERYYYGFGGYYSLFLKLTGRGVFLLKYRAVHGNPLRVYVDANVYTKIENVVLELLMKILKPIVIPLMDKKIYKFLNETRKLAKEITMHPEEVYQSVKESGFADDEELEEFKKLIF